MASPSQCRHCPPRRSGLPVTELLVVSPIASWSGRRRIYYRVEKNPSDLLKARAFLTAGMWIQGFVLVAVAAAIMGALVAGIADGRFWM